MATVHRLNLEPVRRLPDTEANRERLRREAAADGRPSAVADLGRDIALFSDYRLRPTSNVARTPADALREGHTIDLGTERGQAIYTDDGFREVRTQGMLVAVIDSGVDANHPALKGKVLPGYNVAKKNGDTSDSDGHGTHVAGIIAASVPGEGVEGVAPDVKILPITLGSLSLFNRNFLDNLAEGIRYAADRGAKVVNISLGMPQSGFLIRLIHGKKGFEKVSDAIDYATAKGTAIVVAAGNANKDGSESVLFPGNHPKVISVANLNYSGQNRVVDTHSSSSRGKEVDIAAPGTAIRSTFPRGQYRALTGTSMASPYVAGSVALIRARHPEWTVEQVKQHLYRTARDLGKPGRDDQYGHGELDLYRAVFEG